MEKHDLFLANKEFIKKINKSQPDYFEQLKEGQNPDYFIIACSDSRVSPCVVSNIPLGKSFIHRNISNQVCLDDANFSACLYYALKHVNVKEIVIKGHTHCGGIHAAWEGNEDEELQDWLARIRQSLPPKEKGVEYTTEELSTFNVLKQIERLKQHPIYKKYGQGVHISGCVLDIETGKLKKL